MIKRPSVGWEGKTTGWLFVQYLSLKSRALWYPLTLGTNAAEWSQKSVKSLVLIDQQLWYFFPQEGKKKKKGATFWDPWVPPPFFSPLSLSTVAFYCHMGVSSWTTDLGLSKLAWATEDWKTLTKPSHSALSYWTLKTRWKNTNPGKYKRQARIFSPDTNKNEGSVNPH